MEFGLALIAKHGALCKTPSPRSEHFPRHIEHKHLSNPKPDDHLHTKKSQSSAILPWERRRKEKKRKEKGKKKKKKKQSKEKKRKEKKKEKLTVRSHGLS
jgi:hypothetical protein